MRISDWSSDVFSSDLPIWGVMRHGCKLSQVAGDGGLTRISQTMAERHRARTLARQEKAEKRSGTTVEGFDAPSGLPGATRRAGPICSPEGTRPSPVLPIRPYRHCCPVGPLASVTPT